MGGRGSSSMSAGSAASASVYLDPANMTDSQLGRFIASTRDEMGRIGERLIELSDRITEARISSREGRGERVDAAQQAYNEGSDIYNALRDRLGVLEDEQARRRPVQQRTHRPFVNSYGEATRRNITSQSYESAQRRLDQRIESWMRGR